MYEKEGNCYYTPDELGYHDRGMVKWQGFLLADHHELMETKAKEMEPAAVKPQQSEEECSAFLADAFHSKWKIDLQLNILEDGCYLKVAQGHVLAIEEGMIFLETELGMQSVPLDLIRHASRTDSTKWYKKS